MILLLENDNCHVEMVMLHCRCWINCSQWWANINHELIVKSPNRYGIYGTLIYFREFFMLKCPFFGAIWLLTSKKISSQQQNTQKSQENVFRKKIFVLIPSQFKNYNFYKNIKDGVFFVMYTYLPMVQIMTNGPYKHWQTFQRFEYSRWAF